MTTIFKVNSPSSFLTGYLASMSLFWLGLQLTDPKDLKINLMFSFALNTLAFLSGLLGLRVARQWGGHKSVVGKGITFISLGLISWGAVGGYIWSYYNFILNQSVPYPSFSDVGFVAAVPLWAIGMFYLAKATGVKYGLRNSIEKAYLLIIPVVCAVFSYFILVTVARDGSISDGGSMLKVFFDFAYPICDVVIITIALLIYGLTLRLLGGLYKWPIRILLLGFIVMFFADTAFSYTTTVETYFNGNIADLLFTLAFFLMGYGLTSLQTGARREQ